MRLFGFTISKDPKSIPAPPTRFCTCDSLQHLCRSATLARDVLLAYWLWTQLQILNGH